MRAETRGTRWWIALGALASVLAALPAAAAAKDRTIIARNILPSGEYQTPGANAATQAGGDDPARPLRHPARAVAT